MLFKFCTISRDCGKSTIQKCSKINPMCFSVPNSDVLSSQGIKSSIMCFFAPILLFYLFKGSNPISCASLHQFKCFIFSKDQIQYYALLCTNSEMLKDQIQCASLCQIQMCYLLKGSSPVLCASLH